jgi:predicted amidophosphoribosyltransferase
MVVCQSCGKALEATARICPSCGALTGVNTRSSDELASRVLGVRAALVVAFVVALFLRWLGVLP